MKSTREAVSATTKLGRDVDEMSVSRAFYHPVESRPAGEEEVNCLRCCIWDAPVRKAGETGYCVWAGITISSDTCEHAEEGPPIHGKGNDEAAKKYWAKRRKN